MTLGPDVLSTFWQYKTRTAASEGIYHGHDFVHLPCAPALANAVTEVTPGAIPMGKLVVVGAKTGNNKTRFLWNIAADIVQQGMNVGFLSLEVDAEEATPSINSIITGVHRRFIAPGKYYDEDQHQGIDIMLKDMRKKGELGRLTFNESADSIEGITQAIDWMYDLHKANGSRVFCLDYFQLLAMSGGNARFGELNDAVKELIAFRKETRSLLFVASQFNRDSSAPKIQPTAQSLDSCPLLERYAHMVWLIDHSRQDNSEDYLTKTWIIVAKNRHGRTYVDVPIEINYRTHRIRQAMPDEESQWPS